MAISIEQSVIERHGFDIQEFFLCIAIQLGDGTDIKKMISDMLNKHLIYLDRTNRLRIREHIAEEISQIILESTPQNFDDEYYRNIATNIRELYPKGIKPETNVAWRVGVTDLAKRLKKWYTLYPEARNYTPEQIIQATKEYIDSFGGITKQMRVAKYFIWKLKDDGSGIESDLMTALENLGENNINVYDHSELLV